MNDLDMFFWGATKRYVMEKKATFVNFLFHNVHSQHKKVSLSSVLLWFFFRKPLRDVSGFESQFLSKLEEIY